MTKVTRPGLAQSRSELPAGRSCPLHYRYAPRIFARPAEWACEVLYVVGGLYGNEAALESVLSLFEAEQGHKRLVFNGDFHWFDIHPKRFLQVDAAVAAHDAIRGNVETELAADPGGLGSTGLAGCGCAYPDWVDDGVVDRSNRILQRLQQTAGQFPQRVAALGQLPMHLRVNVGALRLGLVHGDAQSLAGWGFAPEHLAQPGPREQAHHWFEEAQVDAFACSHTCSASFDDLADAADGEGVTALVLNNGAAGMPNWRGEFCGLLTRIALWPFDGPERRHGLQRKAVHIEAIAIPYEQARWCASFEHQWPPGSAADLSYGTRIREGAAAEPGQAWRAR